MSDETREHDLLARRFADNGDHLRAVAYRILGSRSEADDALQEAWLRLSRTDADDIDNLRAWLTTVVARVCLDMLRSRRSRREDPLDAPAAAPDTVAGVEAGPDPEHEAVLGDSIGLALLVVLESLTPPERVAFVLHDLFAVPFDEIAPIVGRTPAATRKLASRGRRRVQGSRARPGADLARQREIVGAFLAASRGGDLGALLALLDPDVVLRADAAAVAVGRARGGARRRGRGRDLRRSRACRAARSGRRRRGAGVVTARGGPGGVRPLLRRRSHRRGRAPGGTHSRQRARDRAPRRLSVP